MYFTDNCLIRKQTSASFTEEISNYSEIFIELVISCHLIIRFRKATLVFSNEITKEQYTIVKLVEKY